VDLFVEVHGGLGLDSVDHVTNFFEGLIFK